MMKVLIVKTSSLGDIIHTLPALMDAKKNIPNIEFDWVVEEAFQAIPSWHSAVKRVIPIALKRWRKDWFNSFRKNELQECIQKLRETKYDLIIDAQGLLKSVLITKFCRGNSVGYSWKSARDPLASLFYQKNIAIS